MMPLFQALPTPQSYILTDADPKYHLHFSQDADYCENALHLSGKDMLDFPINLRRCIIKTLFVVTLSLFFAWMGIAAGEDLHVAFFKNTSGDVAVIRNEASFAAAPGIRLMAADRVKAGPEASAGIVFTDGTTVSIGPSTEIEITAYRFEPKDKQYDFSLYIPKGSVVYSSGRLGKLAPEAVNLKTPRATVGVRGTRLIINVK